MKDFVYFPGDKNQHFKFSSVLVSNNKYWAFFTFLFFRCSKCDMYSVIQKDGLNLVHLYFLNYTWYVKDLHNI